MSTPLFTLLWEGPLPGILPTLSFRYFPFPVLCLRFPPLTLWRLFLLAKRPSPQGYQPYSLHPLQASLVLMIKEVQEL